MKALTASLRAPRECLGRISRAAVVTLLVLSGGLAAPSEEAASAVCAETDIGNYSARRTVGAIKIDGLLDEASWQRAEKSRRFVDMVSGDPAWYDTRMATLWDDENLYVGFWIEQPYVEAKLTERGSLIFQEDDAELLIDGGDAYYEFEINAR